MREHATAHLLVLATDTRLPIGVISSLDVARAFAAEQGATENFG
jgi:CBS domain-containing protein